MIGHDCKSCSQEGNCEIQDTDIKATEEFEKGGSEAVAQWVVKSYDAHPNEMFQRALAALSLVGGVEGGIQTLRKVMMDGASLLPEAHILRVRFEDLMAALSREFSKQLIMAASDTANGVAQALGVPVQVRVGVLDQNTHPHESKGSKSCTLH